MVDLAVSPLGLTPQGRAVERYVLKSPSGLCAEIMTLGATLMALSAPGRQGRAENIVLGFGSLAPYLAGTPYFGATVGRYANRIAGARFELEGKLYSVTANEGRNQLHGGNVGFDKVVWDARRGAEGVAFTYVSADGEEGFPGEVTADVEYALTDAGLAIEYRAVTTKPTHVNLTHHSYFNLSGDASRPITDHELMIEADFYTPVDAELIPTGELRAVAGTSFDFRDARPIGARIDEDDPQIRIAGGYDHNFVLKKPAPAALARAAQLFHARSGRGMEVWTTEPGLQFYSGNGLKGSFARRTGLCLEPQHFPNSPNQKLFASTVLRPGEVYRSRTEFRFGAA